MTKFYPNSYFGKEPFSYERIDAKHRYNNLRLMRGNRRVRILDDGCGKGILLHLFQQGGWEVVGVESSEDSAHYARKVFGLDVFSKAIRDCNFSDGSLIWSPFFTH